MKITLIFILFLSNTSFSESLWNLNAETENHLSTALVVSAKAKLVQQNRAGINFVTVGDGNTCDFRLGANRIQDAIDSGASEIRIASNTVYNENILINSPNVDLTLRGGFSDCVQAQNDNQSNAIGNRTEIYRVNGQVTPVISVTNLNANVTTVFENLKIFGGDSGGLGSGGAVSIRDTDSDAVFNNVWLSETNSTFTGGGLSVVNSNSTVILNNTDIFNNIVASDGGGIYCNNFTAQTTRTTIILNQGSSLYNNSAVNGGGALMGKDCFLSSFSGSSIENGEKGIYNNTATNNGGAVNSYAGSNVLIYGHILCNLDGQCFGNSTDPASVYGNQANTVGGNNSGGAFSASGFGTDVTIIAGHIYNNTINPQLTAFGAGGVISLHFDATLNVAHPGLNNSTIACWNSDKCNLFNGNTGNIGGVIYTNDSQVNISHAVFEDNRANKGTAIYVSGTEDLNIENSIFNNNGASGTGNFDDEYVIYANGPTVNVVYTTIADNHAELGVFRINSSNQTLNLQSSIVDDLDSGNVVSSGSVTSHCVMAHEITSLQGTNNVVDDPEFVDRANRDYHLNPINSPAIDYCNEYLSNINKDIEFQPRGFDSLTTSNFLGTYDIGADESFVKTFLTVGSDASCDFNTNAQSIQDAIDTGIPEVRIANTGTHNTTITIESKSVKLIGGYANCNDANNDIQTVNTDIIITNGVNVSAITISGNALRNTVLLENLNLTGKGASALTIINANADILVNNVLIHNNILTTGYFGGGVYILEGFVNLSMVDTSITQNSASQAGGIFCNGGGVSIVMSGSSGLSQNTTTGKGGGAYITASCSFTMYSGTSNPDAQSTVGISANIADEEGGGIYVDVGGNVILNGHQDCSQQCIGDNINPVSINNNKSNGGVSGGERGGGIYMTGTGTKVNIYAGLFSENLSPNGGAIYVNDFASLKVERLSKECWDTVKCNYFFKNRSLGGGTGGAIQNDQGFLNISSAYFEENESSSGSVLYAFGSNSHNTFESSVFNHNNNQGTSDNFVIRAAVSSNVEISHSTFADNYIANTTVFGITSDSELRLFSSIVHETEGDVLDTNPGNIVIDCVMTHETTTFSGTNVFLDDPEFVDRNNRDYHLDMNLSPAIDVCDDSISTIKFKDIDFDERGIDDINVSNVNGLFDVGADEALYNDVIFKDSFD